MSFWSGAPALGFTDGDLQAKFDGGAHDLPLSKTCFRTIILPTKHASYKKFKVNMDIAQHLGQKALASVRLTTGLQVPTKNATQHCCQLKDSIPG